VWSPDGRRLVLILDYDVVVLEPDGTIVNLTNSPQFETSPTWSPDGSRIAYSAPAPDDSPFVDPYEIFVMNADGTDPRRITHSLDDGARHSFQPSWSPDGARIAFTRSLLKPSLQQDDEIFVMNADGSDVRRLTVNFGPSNSTVSQTDWDPDWSPDGSLIAFQSMRDGRGSRVYVMRPDGSELTRLTDFGAGPAWSPDGAKIAFASSDGLYTMNADGTGQTNITTDQLDRLPAWQPLNRSPDCTGVGATPATLAKHNGEFVRVSLTPATDPDSDATTIAITGVTQDERVGRRPDAKSGPLPDQVLLRAERHPRGDGRVYRIAFTATDDRGGECTGTMTVEVRRKRKRPAVDSAPPSYDSFAPSTTP
jgi:Tol biopolymer transport system component